MYFTNIQTTTRLDSCSKNVEKSKCAKYCDLTPICSNSCKIQFPTVFFCTVNKFLIWYILHNNFQFP